MKSLFDLKSLISAISTMFLLVCSTNAFATECNALELMLFEGIPYGCENAKTEKIAKLKAECVNMSIMLDEGISYGRQKGQATKASSSLANASLEDMYTEGISYTDTDYKSMIASHREKVLDAKPGAGQARYMEGEYDDSCECCEEENI